MPGDAYEGPDGPVGSWWCGGGGGRADSWWAGIHDLARYCARLAEIGVLLLPGSVYDEPDHVRIGFGRADMPAALKLLEANLTDTD